MIKKYPTLKNLAPLFFFLLAFSAFSQISQTFTTSGTFTVPAGVTNVTVEAWGGGGAGGSSRVNKYSAGGGGGGAYTIANPVSVTPGQIYAVTVGVGGTQNFGADGGDGGNSTFLSVNANGGKGGGGVTTTVAGIAGAGGLGGTYTGGSGFGGNFSNSGANGGGGGGSAGTASNGNNSTSQAGATAIIGGGNGGNGGSPNNAGSAPSVNPGGGGGGSGDATGGYMFAGGAGANGQIRITWTCPTYSLSSTSVISPTCINNGAVVTLNAAPINLPIGTYTVTYNQSVNNVVTGATKTMSVTTAGTGSFTTNNLSNAGATTITITNLSSGSGTPNCSYAINANNVAIVTVNPLPVAAGTITGSPTVCQGQNTVAYSVPLITNATSYTWAYSGTGATISGSTASMTINFAANATSGNLTVRGTNACGNGAVSANYAVTVNIQSTAPTVGTITQPTCSTATGSVVLSGLPSGNWTINPGTITGTGTSTTISGLAADTYNFTVTNSSNCTSSASANVVINAEPANNVWKGSVSADWNTPGNWCTGVPSIANNLDVVIPSALTTTYSPTISTGNFGYVENILFESGSILTVDDNYLFVKKNLTLNGKIDLNNESQLLQGTDIASNLDAASTGTIEIDQQGTGDSFNYNYWSSPVRPNLASKTYSIGGVLRDGTNPNEIKDITFGPGHTWAELVIGTSPIRLSTYWMYKLENSKGYAAWARVGNTGEMSVGQGYTMKGSNTTAPMQNYTFEGKPNNGDISLEIAVDNDYLVGNPYPSALDAWQFIEDNLAHTGPLYFWEHSGGGTHNLSGYQGGYATYSQAGGLPASYYQAVSGIGTNEFAKKVPGPYIPVGQAFFVVGETAGNIIFNNNQRVFEKEFDGNSIFMKSSNTKSKTSNTRGADLRPKFRIGFDAPKISHRQLLLTIDERATPAYDRGYEAEIYEVFQDDFYWILNNKKYVIQATNRLGLNSEVPLGIQLSKTGMVTVKIDALENVDDDTSIYLKDKLTGETFNMREKPVQLNLTAGKYADRFVLVFKTQKLVTEDVKAEILIPATSQPIIEGIHVFMNNALGELQIKNNSTEEITSVALVNTLGQTVKTWNSNFNIRTISLPISTATGVYLVQITTKTGKTVKKISVE